MKKITYTDDRGFKWRRVVRDEDTEEQGKFGIHAGPPDLRQLDIEGMLREVNNVLVGNELFTWEDVQRNPAGIQAAINIFKRHLVFLYREDDSREH